MQRAAVALLVGLLLGISLPVGAHHSGDQRRLGRRVARLEQRIESIEARVSGHDQRFMELDDQTRWLDDRGTYFGYVRNDQVIASSETCHHLDRAAWGDIPEDEPGIVVLGCVR